MSVTLALPLEMIVETESSTHAASKRLPQVNQSARRRRCPVIFKDYYQ